MSSISRDIGTPLPVTINSNASPCQPGLQISFSGIRIQFNKSCTNGDGFPGKETFPGFRKNASPSELNPIPYSLEAAKGFLLMDAAAASILANAQQVLQSLP